LAALTPRSNPTIPSWKALVVSWVVSQCDGVAAHLVIDEAEAAALYSWLVEERMTIRQILKWLNRGPWLPRCGHRPWSAAVVHWVLSDPLYLGTAYTNRYRFLPPRKPRVRGPRCPANTRRELRPREEWIARV
jgi:site-specific DNA recombinase